MYVVDTTAGADESLLSPEERARAARFLRFTDARRWAASHVALRQILAECLSVPAPTIPFVRDAGGKPHLGAPFTASGVRFNLSHAGDLALIAISTEGREVGVDVEALEARTNDALALAEIACTPAEQERLRAAPEEERYLLFLQIWTLKEASLKAQGIGLLADPRTVETVGFLWERPPSPCPFPQSWGQDWGKGSSIIGSPSLQGVMSAVSDSPSLNPAPRIGGRGRGMGAISLNLPNYIAAVAAQGTDWYPTLLTHTAATAMVTSL